MLKFRTILDIDDISKMNYNISDFIKGWLFDGEKCAEYIMERFDHQGKEYMKTISFVPFDRLRGDNESEIISKKEYSIICSKDGVVKDIIPLNEVYIRENDKEFLGLLELVD